MEELIVSETKANPEFFALKNEYDAESPQRIRLQTFGGSFNDKIADTPTLNPGNHNLRKVDSPIISKDQAI